MGYDQQSFEKLPSSGSSGCLKIGLIGCLVLFLGTILVVGIGGYFGYRYVMDQAESFIAPFEEKGYKRVMAQSVTIDAPVNEKTAYLAQVIYINQPINADVAFACQIVELNSTINGDVDFTGQVFKVNPGGHVTGDVRVKFSQLIQVDGQVDGEITGTWQVMQNHSKPKVEDENHASPDSKPTPPNGNENDVPDDSQNDSSHSTPPDNPAD